MKQNFLNVSDAVIISCQIAIFYNLFTTNRKFKSDTRNNDKIIKNMKKLKPASDADASGCKHTNFRNLDHLL